MFKGGGHRRGVGCWSLDVEAQPGVGHGFGGLCAEAADFDVTLLEVGEVFLQRLDACRAEEDEHIVVESLALPESRC